MRLHEVEELGEALLEVGPRFVVVIDIEIALQLHPPTNTSEMAL